MKRIYIVAVLFFIINTCFGQVTEDHDHEHSHNNEVSIGFGVAYLDKENKLAPNFHFHYVKGVAFENRLGIGIGFETIITEHKHYSVSAVFQYRVYKGLSVVYAPGLLILKEENEKEFQFSQHFEAAYEFELGHIHLGPMGGIGIAKEGIHYMVGLHMGIDF